MILVGKLHIQVLCNQHTVLIKYNMEYISFNDLELRIGLLYDSINSHFEEFKKPEPIYEESVSENGKKQLTITLGGGITSEKEKRGALNRINSILYNIANLKDNLKDYFKKGLSEKIIEINIDNSQCLCIVIDLVNQEKHGYPLTKTNRSKLNPKIVNVENSLKINMPIAGVFYNVMDGQVEVKADIVDFNNNFLFTFEELVRQSIQNWEDFFIKYIPEISSEIFEIRKKKEERKLKITNIQNTVNEALNILKECDTENLYLEQFTLGTIVKFSNKEDFSQNYNGVIVNLNHDDNFIPNVTLLTNSTPSIMKVNARNFRWKIIKDIKANDSALLLYYFIVIPKLRQEIENNF